MGIIIAAGALFTAVYNVLYRYNSSNTTNLNAATAGVQWGSDWGDYNYFQVYGNIKNGNETATVNFENGTYMIVFCGQSYGWSIGATCLAFYKGNNMTVNIGEGGGYPGNNGTEPAWRGCGKTRVKSNFARPIGYDGSDYVIASGGGGTDSTHMSWDYYVNNGFDGNANYVYALIDGTFNGKEGSTYHETRTNMGIPAGQQWMCCGLPATQNHGGYVGMWLDEYPGIDISPNGRGTDDEAIGGCGGGAGYYDGGGGKNYSDCGGGGSCSPDCYPLISSDTYIYPKCADGSKLRGWTGNGYARFFRIDPYARPSGSVVAYGNGDAWLNTVWTDRYTPESVVRAASTGWQYWGENGAVQEFDCGMRTGWVYSVSEDGNSWHGVGPDGLRSATKQDI